MEKHYNIFIFFVMIIFVGCNPDLDYEPHGYEQKIIVEGYIANNEYAKVYLSLNNPTWRKIDSGSILKSVIRTAKVTVSDGETTEVLTSSWEHTHFPPYIYKSTELKGEEGKTYFLKVEYSGHTVTSQTTIPYSTPIESLDISIPQQDNAADTLRTLSATFNIDNSRHCSYRFFCKKIKDTGYYETPFLFNSELNLSGHQTVTVMSKNSNGLFALGDTVMLRFVTIDSTSTQFFKDIATGLTQIQSERLNTLKSNISEPGFGIWCGEGVRNYRVVIF